MQRLQPAACLFAVLIVADLAVAQLAPPSPPPAAPQNPQAAPVERGEEEREGRAVTAPKTSNLPPGAPVITINGVCEAPKAGAPAAKSGCTTIITRAEFEKLADSLPPNMPPQVRKQLATQYRQILFMSPQARKRGLEQSPHYLQMLKFTKTEPLKLELERSLQEEADKVPESESSDFCQKNSSNFQQTTFLHVFVPRTRETDTPKEDATPAEGDAVRKSSEAEMKAGELSGVLNDPTGYYCFKVVSKTTLAQAQDEIRTSLRTQRLQAMRQAMLSSVSADLNQDYFGDAPAAPGMPGGPRPTPTNRMRSAPPPPSTQPKE